MYLVTWTIEVDADDAHDAAAQALEIQRDHESTACVFIAQEMIPGEGDDDDSLGHDQTVDLLDVGRDDND